ncbi:tudor domain protein [Trichuris suis]|nr:tudor domain protein [Trichuris suis]
MSEKCDLDIVEVGSWTSRPSTFVSFDERLRQFRVELGINVQDDKEGTNCICKPVPIDPEWAGFKIQEPNDESLKRLAALQGDEIDVDGLQMFFAIPDSLKEEEPPKDAAPPYDMTKNLKTGISCQSFLPAKRYLPTQQLVNANIGQFRILEAVRTPITLLDWHGPLTFHVRFEALNRLFYIIECCMQLFYEVAALKPITPLCKNLPCAVQHEGQWWRGKVIRRTSDGKLEVKLVDLGCSINLENDNIYPLAEMFALVPPLAFTCYIFQLKRRDKTIWSRFRNQIRILKYRRQLNATVQDYRTGKLALTLAHPKTGRKESTVLKKLPTNWEPRAQILYEEFLQKVEKQVECMRKNRGEIQGQLMDLKVSQAENGTSQNVPPV